MHRFGNIALATFTLSICLQCVCVSYLGESLLSLAVSSAATLLALFVVTKAYTSFELHEVLWRAHFLGLCFGAGLYVANSSNLSSFAPFGWYAVVMSFFHFSEYYVTSIIRPQNLNTDSFLLNHSVAYGIAAVTSWIEFFLELWLFPGLKSIAVLRYTGIFLCVGGEVTRKLAMLTAGSNFDHLVRVAREASHQLVTNGIYKLSRHPSYVGWFYWSIGTQLILCNPFCFVAYMYASWKFFDERIYQEEITLLNFFGKDYIDYQRKVPTGLPFIRGYEL